MARIDAALALAAEGFAVFPIKPNSKAPPLLNGWPQKATTEKGEVARSALEKAMRTPPEWAKGFPLYAECSVSKRYGA